MNNNQLIDTQRDKIISFLEKRINIQNKKLAEEYPNMSSEQRAIFLEDGQIIQNIIKNHNLEDYFLKYNDNLNNIDNIKVQNPSFKIN